MKFPGNWAKEKKQRGQRLISHLPSWCIRLAFQSKKLNLNVVGLRIKAWKNADSIKAAAICHKKAFSHSTIRDGMVGGESTLGGNVPEKPISFPGRRK